MTAQPASDSNGRGARHPARIPWQGWRQILLRVKDAVGRDNVGLIAAGVAFYGLLALFPAIAALVTIFGLFLDPAAVEAQVREVSGMIPEEARSIIEGQLTAVAAKPAGKLGVVAGFSILLAVWSATKGTKALMTALNIAYGESEDRNLFKLNALAVALTLGGIVGSVVAMALVVVVPALLGNLGLGEGAQWLLSVLRWPLLLALAMAAFAVLYRYGPSRRSPRWQWVRWGAAGAVLLWVGASMLFSWYVSNFGSYNETYGSLGAVVILLMWFYISAYVFLLAAEVNAETEHQTGADTTVGPDRPMGERKAFAADNVAGRH